MRPACGRVVGLLCSLLVPLTASADGTYVKEGGGSVTPLANNEVQLVREEIDIEVDRPHLLAPDSSLVVTVTYVFRNHTAESLRIDMGFPLRYDRSLQYLQGLNYFERCVKNPITAFRAAIDGRDVPVRRLPSKDAAEEKLGCSRVSDERGRKLQERDNAGLKEEGFAEYQVWTVEFAPHQERTVTNQFHYAALTDVYGLHSGFVYVLRTGAAWKGTIEHALIRLRLNDRGCLMDPDGGRNCAVEADDESEDEPHPTKTPREARYTFSSSVPPGVTPPGAELRPMRGGATEVVWELRDLEPTQDVRFAYMTARGARRAVRDSIVKLAESSRVGRSQLQQARDTLLALYGVRLDDSEAQARFAKRTWYVADPRITRARVLTLDPVLRQLEARLQ